MESQHPRFTAVQAAFSGGTHPRLDQAIDETVMEFMDSEQRQRLETALDAEFSVYPVKAGEYRVVSPNVEGGENTVYDIDIRYEDFTTCSCGDFFYRCELGGDERCKHLWRTHILIRIGVLPKKSQDPHDWLLDELLQDIRLLEALVSEYPTDDMHDALDEMRDLFSTLKSHHQGEADIPVLCQRRSAILADVRLDGSAQCQ